MPVLSSVCLNENEVLSLLRGALDGTAREDAQKHIDGCPSCEELFAFLIHSITPSSPAANASAPATVQLVSGMTVGRYRIVGPLGAGAMGIVYLAEDRELGRRVALKMLRGRAAQAAERLRREAQSLARLSHPNVIVVHEVGTFEEHVFMVMEFVDGTSLTAWLKEEPRSIDKILAVFAQAGRGLLVAHEAGLVHRDFKPDNVLVGHDGRVRVVDFGLARAEPLASGQLAHGPAEQPESKPLLGTLTRTGAVVGTPAYMAPEQFAGSVADSRTDQFGFCVALFEALYGQRPFEADTLEDLLRVLATTTPSPPRGRAVPARVERAVVRGLRARPDERFANMRELLAELEPQRRNGRLRAALTISGALALGGLGAYVWTPPHDNPAAAAATVGAMAQPSFANIPSPGLMPSDVAPAVATPENGIPSRTPSATRHANANPAARPSRSGRSDVQPNLPSPTPADTTPAAIAAGPNGAPIVP